MNWYWTKAGMDTECNKCEQNIEAGRTFLIDMDSLEIACDGVCASVIGTPEERPEYVQ